MENGPHHRLYSYLIIPVLLLALAASACSPPRQGSQGRPIGGWDKIPHEATVQPQPENGKSSPRKSRHGEETYTFDLPLDELKPRMDSILTEIIGRVGPGMLGHVHTLQDDEDLHFSLQADRMGTPIVCELMNALSIPPEAGQFPSYWHNRLQEAFAGGQTVTARGVFRLWPDHAAQKGAEEADDRPTSNPPHVVEIHPLSGLSGGNVLYDTRASIAPIKYEGEQYAYKDPGRWGDMLSHDIQTHIIQRNGRSYLELVTPQIGFNYWELRGQVLDGVSSVRDGHRFNIHVVTPTRTYREVVRCFTVAGSPADGELSPVQPGSEVSLLAIGRMDLRTLLGSSTYEGPIPVELCVFGINQPDLPSVARRLRREEDSTAHPARDGSLPAAAPAPQDGSAPSGDFPIIGNRNSHIYHAAGGSNLPAPKNRVYFHSEQEAQEAGYRASRV